MRRAKVPANHTWWEPILEFFSESLPVYLVYTVCIFRSDYLPGEIPPPIPSLGAFLVGAAKSSSIALSIIVSQRDILTCLKAAAEAHRGVYTAEPHPCLMVSVAHRCSVVLGCRACYVRGHLCTVVLTTTWRSPPCLPHAPRFPFAHRGRLPVARGD